MIVMFLHKLINQLNVKKFIVMPNCAYLKSVLFWLANVHNSISHSSI